MEQTSQVNEDGRPRQRASTATHAAKRHAKPLITNLQGRQDSLHRRVAFLRGLTVGRRDGLAVQNEAAELAALVIGARVEFEGLLEDAPETVARHSLTRDIDRSLKLLREQLED